MLGDAYFLWGESLAAASLYEEVVPTLADGRLADLIGAGSVSILEFAKTGAVRAEHGTARGDVRHESTVFDGPYASTVMQVSFSHGKDTAEAMERLKAASLLIRCTMRRISSELYERRVRERLFMTRREAPIAAFIVHGHTVTPYNPGSVSYADAHWGADELVHELQPDTATAFWKKLADSWDNPIDPRWTAVNMDIGGGPVEIHALGRTDGGAVLLFSPPSREASTGEVPMLTRRQRDIMNWIAEGKTSAEVAMILDISPRTVEKHLEAVFQRFGVENRVAAVRTYLDLKAGRDPRQPATH